MPRGFLDFGLMLQFLNGKVRKSENYFRPLAKSAGEKDQQRQDEYVPIDQLPEMSQSEFDKLRQQYEQKEPPFSRSAPTGRMTYGSPLSLTKDHPMKLYVEKIKAAIDKAMLKRKQKQEANRIDVRRKELGQVFTGLKTDIGELEYFGYEGAWQEFTLARKWTE